MTVEEYVEASKWQRFAYRLYRNPLVMFGFGPLYLVLISSRFNRKDARKKERNNTYLTNVILVALYTGMILLVGWQAFLIVQGSIMFIAVHLVFGYSISSIRLKTRISKRNRSGIT